MKNEDFVDSECPISGCAELVGDGHWIGEPSGSHTYHTNNRREARIWEHVDGLDVTPSTEPIGSNENLHLKSE